MKHLFYLVSSIKDNLCQLDIIMKRKIIEALLPFTMSPSIFLREQALIIILEISALTSLSEFHLFIIPKIKLFLKIDHAFFPFSSFNLDTLKKNLNYFDRKSWNNIIKFYTENINYLLPNSTENSNQMVI